jgi:RHS repeat-associated protein
MPLPLDRDDRNRFLERLDGVIVLSERDFDAAVATAVNQPVQPQGLPLGPVDEATRQHAAWLAGAANDPASLGVIAAYTESRPSRLPFTGNVFLVGRNPVFDPGSDRMQLTDYRVIAVTLSGTAQWVGTGAALAVDTRVVGEPGRCCGKDVICREDVPGADRFRPIAITDVIGVSTVRPRAEQLREDLGRPAIGFTVYHYPDPDGGGPIQGFPHFCTRVVSGLDCQVKKPTCSFDDPGYTTDPNGDPDITSGSTKCGPGTGGPVVGRNVPKICQQIRTGDELPSECRGWCPNCNVQWETRMGVPRFCAAAMPVPGGGSPCELPRPGQQLAEKERLKLAFGWLGPQDAGTKCTATGRDGIETCITCDEQGNCGEFARKPPFDPTVATNPTKETQKGQEPARSSQDIRFEAYMISAKAPAKKPPQEAPATKNDPPAPEVPPTTTTTTTTTSSAPGKGRPGPGPDDFARPDRGQGQPGGGQPTAGGGRGQAGGAPSGSLGPRNQAGDPVELGRGALTLEHADLSFPGPVWPLEFVRRYRSVSRQRSELGSNWTHNWDVRVEPLTEDTLPEYLSPWCGGLPGQTTAVVLHDGATGDELFVLDIATKLFLPQAGGTATLRQTTDGGWALRDPDGRLRVFDADGYLISDRDRFGAGFAVHHERTPLGELFEYECAPARLAARGEKLTSRRCWVLSYLVGKASRPRFLPEGWAVTAADFSFRNVSDQARRRRLEYAAEYLVHLVNAGGVPRVPESVNGGQRRRPVAVTDDLGRRLEFLYHRAPAWFQGGGHDFRGHPEAGLLAEVRGPAGTSVTFTYERPAGYPAELNEAFLTQVRRHDDAGAVGDVVPAADRELRFAYQWPGGSAAPRPPSYDRWRDRLEASYRAYFATFIGCWYQDVEICANGSSHRGLSRFAVGDPKELARQAANDYVSQVADNIVTVENGGAVETETRYQPDPWREDFGRVTAQRYGSSSTIQDPARVPPDEPEDHWLTTLPKLVFGYAQPGLATFGDRTDAFLPVALRDRYPLEPPGPVSLFGPGPIASATGPGACQLADMEPSREALPAPVSLAPVAYYDLPEAQQHPKLTLSLRRTRLLPDQLVNAQVGNPGHNDLTSAKVADPAGGEVPLIRRLLGQRKRIAANANRICAWVRLTDRDGDVTYFGLNYFGQALVHAVADADGSYIVDERLVNADGRVVAERRPTRTPTAWTLAAGYTAFTYDEIDPLGNRGWDEWLPAFWARRGNLLRVEERAGAAGVVDDDERTNTFVNGVGRYRQHRYEPLYNQLVGLVEGSLEQHATSTGGPLQTVEVPHRLERRIVDYQELSLKVPADDPASLHPVLRELEGWGFHWARNPAGDYDLDVIADWQLPLELFGSDLNGDGVGGHRFAERPDQRAKGLPVAIISARPGGQARTTTLRWSPHGLATWVEGPDGERETFAYYPLTPGVAPGPFGNDAPPSPGDADSGYRGMLARHTRSRFLSAYPAAWGPPGQAPCPMLRGPYQWLLPANTSFFQVTQALHDLGLPASVVDDIRATSNRADPASQRMTGFAYTLTGQIRRIFTDTGETAVVSDPDGRSRQVQDQAGVRVEQRYDQFGQPVATLRYDSNGNQIGEIRRFFDVAGHLLSETVALEPGAFLPVPIGRSVSRTFTWTGEEQLHERTDEYGTPTTFRYNSRKQPTGVVVTAPAATAGPSGPARRGVAYTRDDDGRVVAVRYGALTDHDPGRLTEQTSYDGLGRPVRTLDIRGVTWQHAWSQRDLRTRSRRSDVPYGAAVPTTSVWETRTGYDDFERPVSQTLNGVVIRRATWTVGGRLLRVSRIGQGATRMLPDADGRSVCVFSPDATVTVAGSRHVPHRRWRTMIRHRPDGEAASTIMGDLDAVGLPTVERHSAGGVEVGRRWRWDGDGNVTEFKNHLGHAIEVRRNWAGWPVRILDPRGPGLGVDETIVEHDPRGLPERVTDPSGAVTHYEWNPFGQVAGRFAQGQPTPSETWGYDDLGRLECRTYGSDTVHVIWDDRGDPVHEEYETPSGRDLLTSRIYDPQLGRLQRAVHTNPAAEPLLPDTRVVAGEYTYDQLGRLVAEEITVGQQQPTSVTSDWTLVGGRWRRRARCLAGGTITEWLEDYDQAGRLATRTQLAAGAPARAVHFAWVSDWYAGRVHDQPGHPSPLRERVELDPFGQPSRIRYTVVDTDAAGQPLDPTEGQQYCAGTWNSTVCGVPLLDLAVTRDPLGRIGVAELRWGNPQTAAGTLLTIPQPIRWRGYAYTTRRHLDVAWETETTTPPTPPAPYAATGAAVAAIAQGADAWRYAREPAVGSPTEIAVGAQSRWRLYEPRWPGHQLRTIDVDLAQHPVLHDPAGRITGVDRDQYRWNPDGTLAATSGLNHPDERYAYTHDGRLAALWTGAPAAAPTLTFALDGPHLAAAVGASGLAWEAAWGPGLDRLLEWTDHASGTGTHLPLTDHRGSIIGVWSAAAGFAGSIDHTPEGRVTVRDASGTIVCTESGTGQVCPHPADLPFGFASAWRSTTTGLVWLRHRWYEPRLGQFLSPDPLGAVDSHNLYAYAGFDPINNRDPLGLGSTGPAASSLVADKWGRLDGPGRRRHEWIQSRELGPQLRRQIGGGWQLKFVQGPGMGPGYGAGMGPGHREPPIGGIIAGYIWSQHLRDQEMARIRLQERLKEYYSEPKLPWEPDRPSVEVPSSRDRPDPLLDPGPPMTPVLEPGQLAPFLEPGEFPPQTAPGSEPPSASEWFAAKHHIATNKSKKWSDDFRKFFKDAGVSTNRKDILNYDKNLIDIGPHGPAHGDLYHALIAMILNDFIDAGESIDTALKLIGQEIDNMPEVLDPKWWKQ